MYIYVCIYIYYRRKFSSKTSELRTFVQACHDLNHLVSKKSSRVGAL